MYNPVFHTLRPIKANSSKKYFNSFYHTLSQPKSITPQTLCLFQSQQV